MVLWQILREIQLSYLLYLTKRRIKNFSFSEEELSQLFDKLYSISRDRTLVANNSLLKRIEELRSNFIGCSDMLTSTDVEYDRYCHECSVQEAVGASKLRELTAVLYQLVKWRQPNNIVEVGTNLGVSTSWQAAALKENGFGIIHTYEISPIRIQFAEKWLNEEGFQNIVFHNLDFTKAISESLPDLESIDFAFVDGNHNKEATVQYFNVLKEKASSGAVIVLDDIRWSKGMEEAWETVQKSGTFRCAIEFAGMGIIILN